MPKYKVYTRRSLIKASPVYYLRDENREYKGCIYVEIGDLLFAKDLPNVGRIQLNIDLYFSATYVVVESIYVNLIELYNKNNRINEPYLSELIKDFELILFSWE